MFVLYSCVNTETRGASVLGMTTGLTPHSLLLLVVKDLPRMMIGSWG